MTRICGMAIEDSTPAKGFDYHLVKVAILPFVTFGNLEVFVKCHSWILQGENIFFEDSEVVTADPATEEVATEKPKPEEKESVEEIKKRARKPPSEGPCKGCGQNKPLNRLMLCYSCWVKKQLSDKGWREGQPHPAGCGCDLDCRFESKGDNN